MSSNSYYEKIKSFENALLQYASSIFKTYGKELVLRLEEYNLLQNKHNCIESSTAIGFLLEEFIVSKLEMYTHCDSSSEYVIDRFVSATTGESYDFYSESEDIRFIVNVKVERAGGTNDAIAAIGQLYKNYCLEQPERVKSYIVLKVSYSIGEGCEDSVEQRAKPRNIKIGDIWAYCLEEVDFSKGHKQDNRRWSANASSGNNGRLIVSTKFRQDNKVPDEEVSYEKTFGMIESIFTGNS